MGTDELSLDWQPGGRNGSGTLVARLGDEIIDVDKGQIAKDSFRRRVIDRLCKDRPGIDREAVEEELRRIAAEAAQTDQAEHILDDEPRVVRPERFITQYVSGLTVPTSAIVDGRPAGKWTLYLRWSDGKRERRALHDFLDLANNSRVWIHPRPGTPSLSRQAAWSAGSRKAWLGEAPPPDPAGLFRRICERIAHFIDLPEDRAPGTVATLALWSIFTYIYPAWDATPYLYVGGPVGSGKTRIFEVLQRLVFRPLPSSNLTAACLFRTLHDRGGSLLLDEAERLRSAHPDVQETLSILLAGYKRGSKASRLEPVGDSYMPVEFDVFGPKAVACIAGLPPALASRCIPVMMFRADPDSPKPRRRIDAKPEDWQTLRDDLHVLALEHGPVWLDLAGRDDACPAMSGRQFELWQPLLALASWIESAGAERLTQIVRDHALSTIAEKQDEEAPDQDVILLRILADEVRAGNAPTPSEILEKAKQEESEMFKKWYATSVTRRFRQYDLPTATKSHGVRRFKGVSLDQLWRIQRNYGIDLGFLGDPYQTGTSPNVPRESATPGA